MTVMTNEEFDRRYEELKRIHAGHDRDLAQLLVESGWTQERIAERIGMSQQEVSRQLRFGRFLAFTPNGVIPPDLTEWHFRGHWEATDQNLSEPNRFRAVCERLGIDLPAPPVFVPIESENVEDAIDKFAKEHGINLITENPRRNRKIRAYISTILTKGIPAIQHMVGVGRGKIGLDSVYTFVASHSQEEQEKATLADVRVYRYAREAKTPSKRKGKAPKAVPIAPTPRKNLAELDIGNERIHGQPVLLHPVHIQRLSEAKIMVDGVAARIGALASTDVALFLEHTERLLAYRPVPGKTNGEQRNFAKEVSPSLDHMRRSIDAAIERLCALRDALNCRSDDAPQPLENPETVCG